MIKIIDVSYAQGKIDFKKVKASGEVDAVYCRATQGMTIDDDKFKEYHDGFKSVGIPVGAYHLLEFTPNGAQQAQHFLNSINGREGDLIPMVDVESASLEGPSDLGQRIQILHTYNQFLLNNLGCHDVLIYTNLDFWNTQMNKTSAFQGHKLWIAEYFNGSAPELPGGFLEWKIWQYTDKGMLPGIPEHSVDLNHFNGSSLDELFR